MEEPVATVTKYGSWRKALAGSSIGTDLDYYATGRERAEYAEKIADEQPDEALAFIMSLAQRAFAEGDNALSRYYVRMHDELYAEIHKEPEPDTLPWEVDTVEPDREEELKAEIARLKAELKDMRDVASNTTRPRARRIDILTRDDVDCLVAECGQGYPGTRNRAMIELLWATGCRIGEITDLLPDDIEHNDPTGQTAILHVPETGKTGAREAFIELLDDDGNPTPLKIAIDEWLAVRVGDYLFTSVHGTKVHRNQLNVSLKKYAARCGIKKRIHSHTFRHSYATRMAADEELNAFQIRDLLGHKSVHTSNIYVARSAARVQQRKRLARSRDN